MRRIISFDEGWTFRMGEGEAVPVALPHTWNAEDGQDGGNDYRRGEALYSKSFDSPALSPGERVFLEFGAAAMSARVRLNGQEVCRHEGGYSAFRAEITELLRERDNRVEVFVDNGANDSVYPQMADFTFYGGLTRSVKLIIVPDAHFELVRYGTSGIRVTPVLSEGKARVTVQTQQSVDADVTVTVNGESKTVPSVSGLAEAVFEIARPRLWNGTEDPYLYEAKASLPSGDEVSARFGIRSFSFDAEKGFFLNGRSYPLRGVCRHQDRQGIGSALSAEQMREDMVLIREIGANTVRLAHYQHPQEVYDLCDEYGLIVWAEIPFITQRLPRGRENALSQMRELISQCANLPSIAGWGLSNEISAAGPVTDELLEDHRLLNELCHSMDPSRPTVMAHVFMLDMDSPLTAIPDVSSYNLYFGWYLGETEQAGGFLDRWKQARPGRPIGLSEYGADANPAYHSSRPVRGDYTEEYQCLYHEGMLACIEERPYLWATHVWNMFDFAADGRDEGGRKGVNQKGLVTMDRKTKKDAFYLYKAAWSREPFVHLCGRRYADRAEDVTQVRVYSNQPRVTLAVDGKPLGTQEGRRVFTWSVPITGEHTVEACAGDARDSMQLRRAEKPNREYVYRGMEVVNWFDRDKADPACFSIRDSVGDIARHPQAGKLLEGLMKKMRASRGDVAEGAAGNRGLQALMAGTPLEGLLQRSGNITAEEAKALNSALQKIRKDG